MTQFHEPGSEEQIQTIATSSMFLAPARKRLTLSASSDLRLPNSTGFRRGIASNSLRVLVLVLLDSLSVSTAWQIALLMRPNFQFLTETQGNAILPLIVSIFVTMNAIGGLYKAGDFRRNYLGVVKTASSATLLLLLISILHKPLVLPVLWFWICSIALLCIGRLGLDLTIDLLRSQGSLRCRVFLIADLAERERSIQLLNQQNCYTLIGVADCHALDRANREATFDLLRKLGITEVFISPSAIQNRLYLCWRFQTLGITLRILLSDSRLLGHRSELENVGEVPTSTLRSPFLLGSDYWIKRCCDFTAAAILVVLFSPVYAAIAIAIKFDSPGSVFFKQTRIGLHNHRFKIWKFRTMVQDANLLQASLEAQNKFKDGVLFKMKDDPRVTQVGKFLRRYSLDELPQLFNVLLGDMSLVGPRPLPLRDVEKFKEQHFIRQEVLPGITGLWQVSGRSNIANFEEAVHLDLTYVTRWSLQLDLQILLKTIQVVLQNSGAY